MKTKVELHNKLDQLQSNVCKYETMLLDLEVNNIKTELPSTYFKLNRLYTKELEKIEEMIKLLLWVLE